MVANAPGAGWFATPDSPTPGTSSGHSVYLDNLFNAVTKRVDWFAGNRPQGGQGGQGPMPLTGNSRHYILTGRGPSPQADERGKLFTGPYGTPPTPAPITVDTSNMQAVNTNWSEPGAALSVYGAGAGYTDIVTDSGVVVRRKGARNWRNNNPGNIEFGQFAKSNGAVGSDGRFAVFPSLAAGEAAQEKLLFETPGYRGKTVGGAISRYAPDTENDTRAYVNAVIGALGVPEDTPMADLSKEQRKVMVKKMHEVEGFKVGREIPLTEHHTPAGFARLPAELKVQLLTDLYGDD